MQIARSPSLRRHKTMMAPKMPRNCLKIKMLGKGVPIWCHGPVPQQYSNISASFAGPKVKQAGMASPRIFKARLFAAEMKVKLLRQVMLSMTS